MHERELKAIEDQINRLLNDFGDSLSTINASVSVLPDGTLSKMQKIFQITIEAINEETDKRSLAKAKEAIRKELNQIVFDDELNDLVSVCSSCGSTDTKDVFTGHWTNTHKGWCLNK